MPAVNGQSLSSTIMFNKLQYIKNVVTSNAAFVLQTVALIVMTPIYVETLGANNYGIYLLLFSVISYFMLGNFGLPQTFLRVLIDCKASGNADKRLCVASTVFTYYCMFAVIGNVLLYLIFHDDRLGLLGLFIKDSNHLDIFQQYVPFIGLIFGLNVFNELFQQYPISENKIYVVKFIRVCEVLSQALLAYMVLRYSPSIEHLLITVLASSVAALAVTFYISTRFYGFNIEISRCDYGTFRRLLPSSWWYFVGGVSVILILQLDVFIVSAVVGLQYVALYTTMYRFNDAFRIVLSQLCASIFPTVSFLSSSENYGELLKLYRRFLFSMAGIALVVGSGLYVVGFDLYTSWITNVEFHRESAFQYFVVFSMLMVLDSPSSTFAGAIGIHKWPIVVGFAQGLFKFGISLSLGLAYGVEGVILGSIIALLTTNFWFNPYFVLTVLRRKNGSLA